jgi:hypothetical protein
MAKIRYDPSRDRQQLDRLLTELSTILRAFCGYEPLLRGSLRTLSRRCGKPRCRCTRGKPHRTTVFVDRQGTKPVLRKVAGPDHDRLLPPTAEYRKLRDLRARLWHLHQEVLGACDRLTRFRLAEGNRRIHPSRPRRSP